jgi:hypothetical protein
MNVSNLSRAGGRPYTDKPRVYVGCVPCKQGRYVSSLRWANAWIERHWTHCPRTEVLARAHSNAGGSRRSPSEPQVGS